VGIGTTTPNYQVSFGANIGKTFALFENAGTSVYGIGMGGAGTGGDPFRLKLFSNGTESACITDGGNLLVGGTTQRDSAKITNEFSGNNGMSFFCVPNTSAVDFAIFRANAGTLCGAISRVGTTGAVVYTTTSDYRLKENIAPISGALAKVSTLNPVTFTWKDGGGNADGFIAHEFAEVCPNGVIGEKDGVDENGDPKYQAMDSSVAIPFLAAAIKELKALVDTQASTITVLTTRITALESAT
jgi:hypothetical protein